MGSYDVTVICKLVGPYIPHVCGEKQGKDKIGLYRDDGLTCFRNINGSQAEVRIRKDFISIFEIKCKHSISSKTNLEIGISLNVTLNLNIDSDQTYNKPNNNPLYININSNHSPNIIKKPPRKYRRRIRKLSSSTSIFNNSKDLYNNALSPSGFEQRIKFVQGNTSATPSKNRKKNIIWFHPSNSANATTKIGNKFSQTFDKNFPKFPTNSISSLPEQR